MPHLRIKQQTSRRQADDLICSVCGCLLDSFTDSHVTSKKVAHASSASRAAQRDECIVDDSLLRECCMSENPGERIATEQP
jgi:hypothetical protein